VALDDRTETPAGLTETARLVDVLILHRSLRILAVGVNPDPRSTHAHDGLAEVDDHLTLLERVGKIHIGIGDPDRAAACHSLRSDSLIEVELAEVEVLASAAEVVLAAHLDWHQAHHEALEFLDRVKAFHRGDDEVNRVCPVPVGFGQVEVLLDVVDHDLVVQTQCCTNCR
jgi:hypothetical protein